MTLRGLKMGLMMVLMTAVWARVSAQLSCTSTIMGMYPCLSYVTGNTTTPSSSCCSQLSTVVSNQPQCLCVLLNSGGSSFGFQLNRTQALALPRACNVQTPPVSRCNASPTGTPVSPSTPSKPTVPAANAPTKSTPSISGTPPSKPSTTPATPTKSTPSISGTPPSTAPTPSISGTPPSTGPTTTPDGSKTIGSVSSAVSSTGKPLSLVFSVLFIGSFASLAFTGF